MLNYKWREQKCTEKKLEDLMSSIIVSFREKSSKRDFLCESFQRYLQRTLRSTKE